MAEEPERVLHEVKMDRVDSADSGAGAVDMHAPDSEHPDDSDVGMGCNSDPDSVAGSIADSKTVVVVAAAADVEQAVVGYLLSAEAATVFAAVLLRYPPEDILLHYFLRLHH